LDGSEFDAFSEIYDRHADAACRLALRLTGNRALAEDAVQEAMLRVWRSANSLRPGNARAWVLRIVERECLRALTASQREKERAAIAGALRRCQEADDYSENSEREQLLSALRRAMAALPADERVLLRSCYGKGLSQRRISVTLAIPQQTISYRLRNAVGHLAREFVLARAPSIENARSRRYISEPDAPNFSSRALVPAAPHSLATRKASFKTSCVGGTFSKNHFTTSVS
jgi:RNA polymerase sigma-70 factor (ECF subfamily)